MITAKNIQKSYLAPVLQDVSLQINPGEIIGLAGENGSGKSTLLAILAGIIKQDSGEIEADGEIGLVPQEAALFDNLSVKDNLRFWAKAYKQDWKNALPILADDSMLKKRVSQLSGGMKKRLSIALACLHNPQLLIMDEPTAALDIGFKSELKQMLDQIRSQGRSVIFSTHQPDELAWCDRIYILRKGQFIYEGSPKELGDLSKILYHS